MVAHNSEQCVCVWVVLVNKSASTVSWAGWWPVSVAFP